MIDLIESLIDRVLNIRILKSNKAQLGWIELRFFLIGLGIGLLLGIVLVALSCNDVWIPRIGFMCG